MDYIDGFPYIKPSLHPWDEAYLILLKDHFMCSWTQFAKILLSIFYIDIRRGNWSEVLYLGSFLCGFGIIVTVAS